ncbi:unnamed protein product [Plutella xylostella]|uniref:(diamondback moth) hypothetical protein n=1 Tax=Plutella xylostella TaxID=51655 RepID=A0A8S4EC98_PLUXY|nr:unnamed protein product [Plutella xylostella]
MCQRTDHCEHSCTENMKMYTLIIAMVALICVASASPEPKKLHALYQITAA